MFVYVLKKHGIGLCLNKSGNLVFIYNVLDGQGHQLPNKWCLDDLNRFEFNSYNLLTH